MLSTTEIRSLLLPALAAAVLVTTPGVAMASTEEARGGAELLRAIERNEAACDDLDRDDNIAIGELVMGRMLDSARAHEAMDRMMAAMMGEDGLDRMHEVMGTRFSDCGNPRFPGGFGSMGPMMGMMGGGPGSGGMMGGDDDDRRSFGFGPGSMMADDDDDDEGAWIALAIVVLAFAAVIGALVFSRGRGRPPVAEPLDLLAQRFARGEIGADEYAERRRLLEGGS